MSNELEVWRDGQVVKVPMDYNGPHCCGLQGFNPMLGDECEACSSQWRAHRIASELLDKIEKTRLS